jgi:cytochrome c oxidase subunit 2
MVGEIVVMRPEEYQAWLAQHAEGSPALEGRKVFLKYQCATCHSADALARCPTLEDLYQQRVQLNDGRSVLADENYLRESILKPDAKIVAGYEPIMPSFQGQIDEEEMLQLLTFLKTLHRGGTPPRVERSPPPEIGKQENAKMEAKDAAKRKAESGPR